MIKQILVLAVFLLILPAVSAQADDGYTVVCDQIASQVEKSGLAEMQSNLKSVEKIEVMWMDGSRMMMATTFDAKGQVLDTGMISYKNFQGANLIPLDANSNLLGMFIEVPVNQETGFRVIHQWDYHDADRSILPLAPCRRTN